MERVNIKKKNLQFCRLPEHIFLSATTASKTCSFFKFIMDIIDCIAFLIEFGNGIQKRIIKYYSMMK